MRFIITIVFLSIGSISNQLVAQCSIDAKKAACVKDLVNFNLKSTNSINKYQWNFGAYGTSSNASPTIQVTTTGTVNITCIVTEVSGTTCTTSMVLTVYKNPTASFVEDVNANKCLQNKQVCIKNPALPCVWLNNFN